MMCNFLATVLLTREGTLSLIAFPSIWIYLINNFFQKGAFWWHGTDYDKIVGSRYI
jgi:hypothetical protein